MMNVFNSVGIVCDKDYVGYVIIVYLCRFKEMLFDCCIVEFCYKFF